MSTCKKQRWTKRAAGYLVLVGFAASVAIQCTQSDPAAGRGSEADKTPDRIILIVVDTLRRDYVSAYASTSAETVSTTQGRKGQTHARPALAQTPNIDRLATKGQLFYNEISAFHATTMSMAALFTGRTPSIETGESEHPLAWNTFAACGMSRFSEPGEDQACVPNALDTLAEDLRAAGYWTLGVVSNELLYRPAGFDQGFDQWVEVGLPPPGEKLDVFTASAARSARHVNHDVQAALAKRPSDHFFLYVHYIDVHDWSLSLFRRSYKQAVERFDKQLGELLDALAAQGLLENATVILTSDHGEMLVKEHLHLKILRHFGNPAFEPVLRVPLIVSPPIEANVHALVRTQDVRGMIRSIAGIKTKLTPDLEPNELIISERFYQNYRKGRFKSLWKRNGGGKLLFDLVADPGENADLSEQRPDIMLLHRNRIDELSLAMASNASQAQHLSQQDLDRLGTLGYIQSSTGQAKNLAVKPRDSQTPKQP